MLKTSKMSTSHLHGTFQEKFSFYFSERVQMRGTAYFKRGQIFDLRKSDSSVSAMIAGTSMYLTSLDWSNKARPSTVQAYCSCPYSVDGDFCKHLWALILQVDQLGISKQFAANSNLRLAKSNHRLALEPVDPKGSPPKPQQTQWRDVFRMSSIPAKRIRPHFQEQICLVMESDREAVRFRFYASQLDQLGQVQADPKPLNLSMYERRKFHQANVQAVYETLLSFDIRESVQSYHYYRTDRQSLTTSSSSVRMILPWILESVPVFASFEELLKTVQNKEDHRLRSVEMGPLSLNVSETANGYLLEGTISIQSKSDPTMKKAISLRELQPFSSSGLYRVENLIGVGQFKEEEAPWIETFSQNEIFIPIEDSEAFLETIHNHDWSLVLPVSLQWPEIIEKPRAKVRLVPERRSEIGNTGRYLFDLQFQYGGRWVSSKSLLKKLACGERRQILPRNLEEENRIWSQTPNQFLILRNIDGDQEMVLAVKNLLPFVQMVLASGIEVEIEHHKIQSANDVQVEVSSGVDWFEVDGQASFSGLWVKFPTLLEAVQKGENFVPLPDGSLGIMNEALRRKIEKFSDFAQLSKEGFRFQSTQGLLLNSLLESETSVKLDANFKRLRTKIKSFSGISAVEPPAGFKGKLRNYQKEGLGWLKFLEAFGLGGILADDMGLGKTIQCLAFLETRRLTGKRKRPPSLLIAPKSLLSNWQAEAQKFAPKLQVMLLTGLDRQNLHQRFKEVDLVVTTYQTMLRDFEVLKETQWDCIVLDEAQAIKNREALISKAVKMLTGKFRLAMTGTPIENSIQDLYSISDFVNPGFLRGQNRSHQLKLSEDSRQALSRAFKPVILRRTKDQVLKDLPSKTEQTIIVELEAKQLRGYNELKKFYKSQLLKEIEVQGFKKSQIQILAALTRLRQAALHSALIDPSLHKVKSAKFEILLQMLEELISEGHRVLVFSQFTNLLGLLKDELSQKKIDYCYLDGKTTNRQKAIQEFKSGSTPVFLMSLKAGGVGLNLVEANYVFLLDPWWNPAVEAQAIDRVHRMGQSRAVNAYRLIAKGTVEEKILELQKLKKGISSEILDGQSSLIRNLTAQDIENLFE